MTQDLTALELSWAAEDEADACAANARSAYYALIRELDAVCPEGLYLTDENIDRENAEGEERGTEAFWQVMLASAAQAAGTRAAVAGWNINTLLGRAIY